MTDAAKESTPAERLEAILRKTEARDLELKAQYDAQRAIDLEALFELQEKHGKSRVAWLDVPHTPGLPTLIATKCPTDAQMNKYRTRVKTQKNGQPGDSIGGATEMAAQTRIYPPRDTDPGDEDKDGDETYRKLLAERPGIHVQLGVAAVKLGSAREQDEGKD